MRSEMTFLLSVHYHLDFPHNFAPEICQNTEKHVVKNGMNYLFIGLTNVSMYMTAGILDRFSCWISTKTTPFELGSWKFGAPPTVELLRGPCMINHPSPVTRFDHQNGVVMHIYISIIIVLKTTSVISWWASWLLLITIVTIIFWLRIWCLSIKADWIN